MNLIKLGIDLLGAVFEIFLIEFFFSLLLDKKESGWKEEYMIRFFALVLLSGSGMLPESLPVGPLLSVTAVFLLTNLFQTKFIMRIICSLITFSIFLVSEILTGMLLVLFIGLLIEEIQQDMFLYLCAVIFSKFIMYFILLLIKDKTSKKKIQKPWFASYVLVMPLSSAFTIYLLFLLGYDVKEKTIILLLEVGVFLLIFANIATLYIMDRLLEYEADKEKLYHMETQFRMQENHYKELEQRQNEVNETYHNMKNYLLAIGGYLDNLDYDRAKEKISQACESLSWNHQNGIQTGNICLDALLNAKSSKMLMKNIEFDYKVRIPQQLSMDYIDLCVVAGNALDNAVEACEKIMSGKRRISFVCIQTGNYISIVITNTTEENTWNANQQSLVTTKPDKHFHGYGLQSIRHITGRNNGNVLVEQEKGSFQIKILLYNEVI